MKRQQQGFTLIELVIVIVILGILSAFALPRFADLGGDARAAAVEGAAGSLKSSASIVRSACLADSDCASDSSGDIDLEGETINLVNGYPAATTDGIQLAAQLTGDDQPDGTGDYQITADDTATPPTLTVESRGASGTCQTVYTEAPADGSPSFSTDVSGC